MMWLEERDEKAAQAAERQARRARQFDEALAWVASDPRGRLFLWELMARSNWLSSRLAGDPCLTAWNDGRAETGNYLFAALNRACPERFTTMQLEAASRDAAEQAITEGETNDRASP